MSVLLAHEKKGGANAVNAVKAVILQESSDSSDNEDVTEIQAGDTGNLKPSIDCSAEYCGFLMLREV